MKINKTPLCLSLFSLTLLMSCTEPRAGRFCEYDPTLGQPSPLGEAATFSIREQEGDTIFTYQPDPAESLEPNIELSAKRELTYRNTDLDTGRVKLIQNQEHYNRLIGEQRAEDFAAVNQTLTCR
jgi:hypothetical protein